MNTSFSPELLEKSVEKEAAERVQKILHPAANGPDEIKPRKPRSDKGIPKKPVDLDGITLHVSLEQARKLAMALAAPDADLASFVQDQIIAQLQKRIDTLSRKG